MYSYFIFTIERLRFRARLIFVSKKIFLTKSALEDDTRFAGTRTSTPRVRTYSETCDDDATKAPRSSRSRDTHVQSIEDCQARRSRIFFSQQENTTRPSPSSERRRRQRRRRSKRNVHKRREEIFQSTLHSKMTVETAELIAKNFESWASKPRELRKIVVKQNVKLILFEAVAIMFNLGVTVAIYSIFLLNGAPLAWEPGRRSWSSSFGVRLVHLRGYFFSRNYRARSRVLLVRVQFVLFLFRKFGQVHERNAPLGRGSRKSAGFILISIDSTRRLRDESVAKTERSETSHNRRQEASGRDFEGYARVETFIGIL